MARYSFEEINEILDAAIQTGVIYNVDFNEVKDRASRLLDDEAKAIRAPFFHNGEFKNRTQTESDVDECMICISATQFPSKKMVKLMGQIEPTEFASRTQALIDRWSPVKDKLAKAKTFIVKGRKPSTDPRKTPERTLENTGTCACCGQNVKMNGGKIVHHGFTIYYGFRNGSCIGVGYEPVEVSPEGIRAVLRALSAHKVQLVKAQKGLYDGATIRVMTNDRRNPRLIEIKPEDRGYAMTLRSQQAKINHDIEMTDREIVATEKRIEDWKPGVLPG